MQLHFSATLFLSLFVYHCCKVVVNPVEECNSSACLLPDCFCSTTTSPLPAEDSPQIVILAFEDSMTELIYTTYYKQLFNFTNPDGCPIGLTFFLSHEYTDYQLVNDVWNRGNEIASNSISNPSNPFNLDYQEWIDEMYGMKQIASNFGNISAEDIVGSRRPTGQVYGDVQFQALYDSGFHYDNTLYTTDCTDPPLFPFTLDYKPQSDCGIFTDLNNSYPGFWEVPLVALSDNNSISCITLDACLISNWTDDHVYEFMLTDFWKHYDSNKAPFVLSTHASWFLTDVAHWQYYYSFISYLTSLPDVYIMTQSKAVAWMKQPTALWDLPSFQPWACPSLSHDCFPKSNCYFAVPNMYMNVCGDCPPHYPWVRDPYGNATF